MKQQATDTDLKEAAKRRKKAVLKQKMEKVWQDVKDLILCLMLLNALIGQLKQVDIYAYMPQDSLEIERVSPIAIAEASTHILEAKASEIAKQPVIVTSYNAEEGQTDADPYTMASNKRVFEGAVASNCHPFGTKVEIEGVGSFEVQDRMNSRYTKDCGTDQERMDIFRFERKDNITIKEGKYSVKS